MFAGCQDNNAQGRKEKISTSSVVQRKTPIHHSPPPSDPNSNHHNPPQPTTTHRNPPSNPNPNRHKPPQPTAAANQPQPATIHRNPPPKKPETTAHSSRLPSLPVEKNKMYLVASKKARRLYLFQGKREVRVFRVTFGATDEDEETGGDKQAAGDDRSPLGVFLVDQASPVSDPDYGGYWMRLDTTLKARQLYKQHHKKIVARWQGPWEKIKEDQDVRDFNRWAKQNKYPLMFRGIGIHGGGWPGTNGCIALSNNDIKELYQRLSSSEGGVVGVRVEIRP